ncbi:MAG: hypothetical protein HY512_03045 [Candidatus Aenigmarchaeota archaeon]|nr:hypothetical protein [Candidatus Aenigmarchaeota archaeon]
MMKGLTVPLTVVLTLVVILIVAVIVLVIFQGGLGPAVEFGTARNACLQAATTICSSSNSMPGTWEVATNRVKITNAQNQQEDAFKSCKDVVDTEVDSVPCACNNKQLVGC